MAKPTSGLSQFFLTRCIPYVLGWTVLGFLAWNFVPTLPMWLTLPNSRVLPDAWGRLAALFAFQIAVSSLVISGVLNCLRVLFGLISSDDMKFMYLWPPLLVGSCEAVLYPTAILLNQAEFIGVWLAVKVAGHWGMWAGRACGQEPLQHVSHRERVIDRIRNGRRATNSDNCPALTNGTPPFCGTSNSTGSC